MSSDPHAQPERDPEDGSQESPGTEQAGAEQQEEQGEGAVSEVANLGDGGPIQPDQSVAGSPHDDTEVQEGKQGPNARTGNDEPGN